MSAQVSQFIMMLSAVHKDGRRLSHFARKMPSNREISTMPVTAFIYQFFIYNSLYSIDWKSSFELEKIVLHQLRRTEGYKQEQFEEFLRSMAQRSPLLIQSAFSPLREIPLDEPWIDVVPDPFISVEDGRDFFNRINQLYNLIQGSEAEVKSSLGQIFSRIQSCRLFVYKVRNNIFHGTKSLGQIWDSDQQRRIEIYLQFLSSLVSCFFLYYEVAIESTERIFSDR